MDSFIAGPGKKSGMVATVKTAQELFNECCEVFSDTGCFKDIFSLQSMKVLTLPGIT